MRLAALAFGFIACTTSPAVRPADRPSSTELSPALAPLAWWLGDWNGDHGSEHWIAADGALYGVAFGGDGRFEVMIVDDAEGPGKPDGVLRLFAMPSGARSVEFRQRELGDASIAFANDAHDYPKTIRYRRDGAGLAAETGGGHTERFAFRRGVAERAPELEAADTAFSADTAASGVDGWVAAFDDRGAMMRKTGRVEGKPAIADAMRDLLASGRLAWAPIASGRAGELGYTVGKATFTGRDTTDNWRSTYVTIWRKQPDGAWKVWFDVGRVVNE